MDSDYEFDGGSVTGDPAVDQTGYQSPRRKPSDFQDQTGSSHTRCDTQSDTAAARRKPRAAAKDRAAPKGEPLLPVWPVVPGSRRELPGATGQPVLPFGNRLCCYVVVGGTTLALSMRRRGNEIRLWRNDGRKWKTLANYDDSEIALGALNRWYEYLAPHAKSNGVTVARELV